MPAVSKAQQKFMGMVHAAQKGEKPASKDVAKAADSMSDKDAKDFASTKHKGLPDHVDESNYIAELKEKIRQLVRERMIEEMTGSDAAGPYLTPYAFTKKGGEKAKGKKQASLTGYSVVNETKRESTISLDTDDKPVSHPDKLKVMTPKGKETAKDNKMADVSNGEVVAEEKDITTGYVKDADRIKYKPVAAKTDADDKKKDKELAKVSGAEIVADLHENRWLELKREVSTPTAKIGKGIANMNKQLAEMERFLGWYGKIKNESGVTNENFWKRTNNHIYKIKERLIKIEQQIRKIGE